jgi:hypothetical protein
MKTIGAVAVSAASFVLAAVAIERAGQTGDHPSLKDTISWMENYSAASNQRIVGTSN